MHKRWLTALLTVLLLAAAAGQALAKSSGSYTYDADGDAVPSRAGYIADTVKTAAQIDPSLGSFSAPQDLCVDETDGAVYILDSGNNRVVVLTPELTLRRVIDRFVKADGTAVELQQPTGLYVREGTLYIADPNGKQLLVCADDGTVRQQILRPETNLLPADVDFAPRKVLADSEGNLYASVTGVYQGALLFDAEGNFDGFFGSNEVEVTAALLLDRFWKSLLTDTQAANISRYVPEEFTSFDIDSRDFLYTVTQSDGVSDKIKKLNPTGSSVLRFDRVWENEQGYAGGKKTVPRFADTAVTAEGNVFVLDVQYDRLYEYSGAGELLFICGGAGQQAGTFRTPVAVDTSGEAVLVLDAAKNNLTVLRPTAFARQVHEAVALYTQGRYGDAVGLWRDILKSDHNYTLANVGLGKALLADGQYKEAAECFRLGGDTEGNSDAFKEYRNAIAQRYFPLLCLLVIVLIALLVWWVNRPRRPDRQETLSGGRINPLRMLFHPQDTAEEIKRTGGGSMAISALILLLWFAATVMQVSLTGFRFNPYSAAALNVGLLFLRTVPLFAVWVAANWGVCTLLDGKGRMKDIFITNAYCLIPYTVSLFLYTAMSHLLVDDEAMFMQGILMIGAGWSLLMLFGALAGIHDYFPGKTLGSILLTLLGVLIVLFLLLLVSGLLQKGWAFVYSLVNELLYRVR